MMNVVNGLLFNFSFPLLSNVAYKINKGDYELLDTDKIELNKIYKYKGLCEVLSIE